MRDLIIHYDLLDIGADMQNGAVQVRVVHRSYAVLLYSIIFRSGDFSRFLRTTEVVTTLKLSNFIKHFIWIKSIAQTIADVVDGNDA
jgi:hypothetical protein